MSHNDDFADWAEAILNENAELRRHLDEAVTALNDVLPYVPPFVNFGQNEEGRRRYATVMRKAEDIVRKHKGGE